jgi:Ser/Thr protein kinase RdoA (MazF antagonist)
MTSSSGIATSASALRRRHSSSCRTASGGLNSAIVTSRTQRPYATYATASGESNSAPRDRGRASAVESDANGEEPRRRDRSLGRLEAVSPPQDDLVSAVQAMRTAGIAARQYGINDAIEPLRTGDNHVFRAGDVVIRVAPGSADVSSQIALARWLISDGFQVAAPLADAEVIDGSTLSLWEYVHADARRPIDFEQLGETVARLHRIAPSRLNDVVALPFCGDATWLAIEDNLALAEAAEVVGPEGLAALRRECRALRGWQERAREDSLVVCHGDVHPQNVLMRGHEVVILDWDTICIGPPAWDHAALITWADRWGGAAETYPDFARGYGADLRSSPLAKELAALRLLAPTINTIINAASDPRFVGEAEARMRYWLGDPAPPTWTPL